MLWTFGAERSSDGVKGTDRHGNGSLNLQPSSYLYPVSFIPGRANASPSNTQGGSPVRESRPPGSVRGAPSNGCPYRDSVVGWNAMLRRGSRMFRGRTLLLLGLGLSLCLTTLSATAAGLLRPAVDFPLPVDSYHDQEIPSIFGKLMWRIQREPLNLVATLLFF